MTTTAEATLDAAASKTGELASRTESVFGWALTHLDGLLVGGAVALGIVGLMIILRWAGERLLASDPHCSGWRGIIGNVLAKTSVWFMTAAAIVIVLNFAPVPAKLDRLAGIFFTIAAALQGAVWAREIILGVVRAKVGEDPGESTLGNAISIIRVLVSVAAFALALLVILDNLGVNVTTLVAGLGIGGIAIGLAAQGIFSDLFAGLAIVFDRPFRRGDTIRYGGAGGTTGVVERIGLKTTRIRAVGGEQVVMANTKLLEQELTNVAEARVRRIWLPFGLTYQTAPETIDALPERVGEVVRTIKTCRLVRCVATQFGPSSIDCELVYDDRATDPDTLARHKSAIIVGIMALFRREGIDFAYPTQTTFTAAPDGTMIMPYATIQPVVPVEADQAMEADRPARETSRRSKR